MLSSSLHGTAANLGRNHIAPILHIRYHGRTQLPIPKEMFCIQPRTGDMVFNVCTLLHVALYH